MGKKNKNNWSAKRNRKIRERIRELRDNGERPSEIYEIMGEEFSLSPSRIKCIEYGVKAG